jgi:cytochrome c553
VCDTCHGPQGEGIQAIGAPRISGLTQSYIVNQLDAFRSGRRGASASDDYGKQMAPMAALLPDDAAIADVAAYVKAFPVKRVASDNSMHERGHALFQSCAACHGPAGEGGAAQDAPMLAGQDARYVARQLQAFRQHLRGGPGDTVGAQAMAAAIAALSHPDDDEEVAGYLATLSPPHSDR